MRVNDEAIWSCTNVMEGEAGNQRQFRLLADSKNRDIICRNNRRSVDDVLKVPLVRKDVDNLSLFYVPQGAERSIPMSSDSHVPKSAGYGRSLDVTAAQAESAVAAL